MKVYQLTQEERDRLLAELELEKFKMKEDADKGRGFSIEDVHRRFHYLVSVALS